jgi:2-keto-4-pentenoate hydratase
MADAAVPALAAALAEARHEHAPFVWLPEPRMGDLDFAYAVQDALVALWRKAGEGEVAGWKIGFTTASMQGLAGMSEPAAGALLSSRLRQSGARLDRADLAHLGLEGEIAVRVALPFPETEPVSPDQALARLDMAAPAFEVTDDRHADWARIEGAALIADNIWNWGAVIGPPTPIAALATLSGRAGVVTVNGEIRDRGMSEDIGCDPAAIVAWLGAHLARRGQPLQPGQWILTGSFVPTTFPALGDHYRFEVEGLGAVEVGVE